MSDVIVRLEGFFSRHFQPETYLSVGCVLTEHMCYSQVVGSSYLAFCEHCINLEFTITITITN